MCFCILWWWYDMSMKVTWNHLVIWERNTHILPFVRKDELALNTVGASVRCYSCTLTRKFFVYFFPFPALYPIHAKSQGATCCFHLINSKEGRAPICHPEDTERHECYYKDKINTRCDSMHLLNSVPYLPTRVSGIRCSNRLICMSLQSISVIPSMMCKLRQF